MTCQIQKPTFCVVCLADLESFENEVNQLLAEGWRMAGPTFVKKDAFCQPMIKHEWAETEVKLET